MCEGRIKEQEIHRKLTLKYRATRNKQSRKVEENPIDMIRREGERDVCVCVCVCGNDMKCGGVLYLGRFISYDLEIGHEPELGRGRHSVRWKSFRASAEASSLSPIRKTKKKDEG